MINNDSFISDNLKFKLVRKTVAFLVPRYVDARWYRYAIALETGIVVRSAPGHDEPAYFEARQGDRFRVMDTDMSGWLRVKRPSDGRVGYCPEEVLGKI